MSEIEKVDDSRGIRPYDPQRRTTRSFTLARRSVVSHRVRPYDPQNRSARDFIFTWDIDDESQRPTEMPEGPRYVVYQLERNHDAGRLRCQGYIHWTNPQKIRFAQALFSHFSVRRSKTNPTENIARCTKEDVRVAGPWEFGEPLSDEERLTDCEFAVGGLNRGESINDLIAARPSLSRLKSCMREFEAIQPPRLESNAIVGAGLCPYQRRVMDILAAPRVRRRIHWIWSDEFGTDKTVLLSLISSAHKTLVGNPNNGRATAFSLQEDTQVVVFRLDGNRSIPRGLSSQLEHYSDGGVIVSPNYNKFFYGHCVVLSDFAPPPAFVLFDRTVVISADRSVA